MNAKFSNIFPNSKVHHLFRQELDHAPLYVICKSGDDNIVKPFRFLKLWCKYKEFKNIVKQNWEADFIGSPFMTLHAKLKRVKRALVGWSKIAFGNIFIKKATQEDIILVKETQLELDPSPHNRLN